MKTLKERIEIEQACLDGAEIESQLVSTLDDRRWQHKLMPVDRNTVVFSWDEIDYRIKEEPMELWVNVWDNGHCCIKNDNEATPPGFKTIKVRQVEE